MTARCPSSGPSQVKPGVGGQVVFSAGLISAGLLIITPWLAPVAGLIDAFVYDALTQCASDPPAMPSASTLSPVNAIGGVLNPNFGTWLSAVHDLLLNWAWDQYCQCTSGTATPVTYPPAPTNTTIPVTGVATPCLQGSYSGDLFDYHTNPQLQDDCTGLEWTGTESTSSPVGAGIHVRILGTPLPQTFVLTGTVSQSDSLARDAGIFVQFYNASGSLVQNNSAVHSFTVPSTFNVNITNTVPATAVYAVVTATNFHSTYNAGAVVQLQMQWGCGGGATAPGFPQGCCTDPATGETLSTILQLLQSIYQSIPTPIHSYATSTVHSGLTGSGHITLGASTIALEVTFTPPASLGQAVGDPTFYFDAGFITTSIAGGAFSPMRLEVTPQLYQLHQLTDEVHYTLNPLVTATITELVAGP